MAVGLSTSVANELLDALCNADPYSVAAVWVQLHIGDPGAAGTTNPAVETDRVQASFGAAASGAIANDAALTWTAVAGAEDYTHWSAWSASTAGTFLFSGTMTANAVLVGDNFEVPIGDLDLSFGLAG